MLVQWMRPHGIIFASIKPHGSRSIRQCKDWMEPDRQATAGTRRYRKFDRQFRFVRRRDDRPSQSRNRACFGIADLTCQDQWFGCRYPPVVVRSEAVRIGASRIAMLRSVNALPELRELLVRPHAEGYAEPLPSQALQDWRLVGQIFIFPGRYMQGPNFFSAGQAERHRPEHSPQALQ